MLKLPATEDDLSLNACHPVLYWNHAALEMNRITHSLGGPQAGPTMSSRFLGLLHLAMHDAYFALRPGAPYATYLPQARIDALKHKAADLAGLAVPTSNDSARAALTGAAVTTLERLYGDIGPGVSAESSHTLRNSLAGLISAYRADGFNAFDALDSAHLFGTFVADALLKLLAVGPEDIGADAGAYTPRVGPFYFRDEPLNPLRRVPIDPNHPERGTTGSRAYHGPFYGSTVRSFAVQNPSQLELAPPPHDFADLDYQQEVRFVRERGGAPNLGSTHRSADQTVAAYYWAYDGANLIGTPPRLYNQILRAVALRQFKPGANLVEQHDELVRLFALSNVAMADAGKFAWKEKFRHNYWRPLTAVRENDAACGPRYKEQPSSTGLGGATDPFWAALGAPETNTHRQSFKPPFPAYPSGHATFGAACFQMARLYYRERNQGQALQNDLAADELGFDFVSDELNGLSRDLHAPFDPALPIDEQPGNVRTRVVRHFNSLWQAIYENAISRVYLGVHFRFDAFKVTDQTQADQAPAQYADVFNPETRKQTRGKAVGGVPLGLGIANDIFGSGLCMSPDAQGALAALAQEPAEQAETRGQARSLATPKYKASNTNIR